MSSVEEVGVDLSPQEVDVGDGLIALAWWMW